jgi:hypothetical protein
MDIIISHQEIDLQECDFLVCGFFSDERPLKGSIGLVDWRLNGRISRFLKDGKITGNWKETILIPSNGRILPRLILLYGLGSLRQYSYLRIREVTPSLLKTLHQLDASNICFSLPYHEDYNVDCGKLVEVLIEGIGDFLDRNRSLFKDEWSEKLRLLFAEGEKRILEILLGVQTAKFILKDRFDIRIFTPSDMEGF